MKRIILVALVGVLVSGPVWAEEKKTIGYMLDLYDKAGNEGKNALEQSIATLGNGIFITNTFLSFQDQPLLFCPPHKLSITITQYFSIFRKYVENDKEALKAASQDKAFYLLLGLMETFPCK